MNADIPLRLLECLFVQPLEQIDWKREDNGRVFLSRYLCERLKITELERGWRFINYVRGFLQGSGSFLFSFCSNNL